MELKVLKNFVKREVEILVGGVWVTGTLLPIVESVITLIPMGTEALHYGPTALKAEMVQAIREVRKQPTDNAVAPTPTGAPAPVQSSFNSVPQGGNHPGNKFVHRG